MALIKTRESQGVRIIEPTVARLDASVAPSFREQTLDYVRQGSSPLIINLSAVEFMDSAGLGVLIFLMKALDGRLAVCSAGNAVRELLALMQLDQILPIVGDEYSALRRLTGN